MNAHPEANANNTSTLIPLTSTDDGLQAVMGRDLHKFLEITTPYHKWFPRMVEYGFTAGQDFGTKMSESSGGRPSQDHVVSLDMAKEISMIQRTEKGKQARQYFIECEKRTKQVPAALSRKQILTMALEAEERAAALEAKAAEDAPKVDYHDRFVAADDDVMTVGDWGAHYGLTRPQAFARLVEAKIIYRKVATQEFSEKHGEVVDRTEYRAYAGFRNLFELRAQHNAPRYHNGQVRQTLYVKSAWAFSLASQAGLEDLKGQEVMPLP